MRGLFESPSENANARRSGDARAQESAPGAAPSDPVRVLVAVEQGIDRFPEGLTYLAPGALRELDAGDRVAVPLGRSNREVTGYVIRRLGSEEEPSGSPAALKAVIRRDDSERLPAQLIQLARWMSAYYCCPLGPALTAVLPAAVRKGIGRVRRTFVDLAEEGRASADSGAAAPKLNARQLAILEVVRGLPAGERPIELRDLAGRAGLATVAPLKTLVARGALVATQRSDIEARFDRAGFASPAPTALTAAQRSAEEAIARDIGARFGQHLLFGVTGSGKTEVYIRLVERARARGLRALVLVPEISLTPQTAGRLVSRFPGERVAILHSGLTAAQRHREWLEVARGAASIVLGARSAVFAPVPDGTLGVVIVDEEHDSSYKSDQQPRYHGRDVAIRRAQLAGCPIVLGSATPSLESWANATRRGTSTLHRLPERAPGLSVPKVRVVDFAAELRLFRDRRVHLIGPSLREALAETLARGGQAILLLNRRGYANYVACADCRCGWIMGCSQCDAGMICHRDRRVAGDGAVGRLEYVRCHHCGGEERLPTACPRCNRRVGVFGLGTQRVEEELARLFPALVEGRTMLRVDADAVQRAVDFRDALERFGSGAVRVLLGTQMIAKGLDFPGVRLVGVISADTALHLPDFRAAERTFQLVSQVAGRCGRGVDAGLAIVQTFEPLARPIVCAARQDFEGFAREELAERTRFGLPPATRMTRLVVRDAGETACRDRAAALAEELRTLAGRSVGAAEADARVTVRGPAPCPIARIAGRYRQEIAITAQTASEMTRFLTAARNAGLVRGGDDLAVDVDPIAMM